MRLILVTYPDGSVKAHLGLYSSWDLARAARDRFMNCTPGYTFDAFDFTEFTVDEDRHGRVAVLER